MDRQEYLGLIAILENAQRSIQSAISDLDRDEHSKTVSRLSGVALDLERAIMVYREKAGA